MKKILVGNLKMNFAQASLREQYLKLFQEECDNYKSSSVELILCPPVIYLERFLRLQHKYLTYGGQDCFWKDEGSYTGEISSSMLSEMGCAYVIIGHSERRQYLGETDDMIAKKIFASLRSGLKPILCIGESLLEKNDGRVFDIISEQLRIGLEYVVPENIKNVIIAYEPVWAIGTHAIPSVNEILGVKLLIREKISEFYSEEYAKKVSVLYGGSVDISTVRQTCIEPGMDGALIGSKSLIPKDFFEIALQLG